MEETKALSQNSDESTGANRAEEEKESKPALKMGGLKGNAVGGMGMKRKPMGGISGLGGLKKKAV